MFRNISVIICPQWLTSSWIINTNKHKKYVLIWHIMFHHKISCIPPYIHVQTKLTRTYTLCNLKGFESWNTLVGRIKPRNSFLKILKFLFDTFQSRLNNEINDISRTSLMQQNQKHMTPDEDLTQSEQKHCQV
jgi:hypothetical protein